MDSTKCLSCFVGGGKVPGHKWGILNWPSGLGPNIWRKIMKYVCFGYFDEEAWAAMSESEQQRFMDECFACDAELRKNGQSILGGEALQTVQNAKTVRFRNGKVMITDGPYAETKEQIGGFFFLEARDMDEAVRLVSNHPGLKTGPF
jgi:hypothetical protein